MKSYKNHISADRDSVKKTFKSKKDFLVELFFLREFSYLEYIPQLIDYSEDTIVMNLIDGKNTYELKDLLLSDENFLDSYLSLFAKTLADFHNKTYNADFGMSVIHNDTNLRNYLYNENKIFMLDFSDISFDFPERDICSLAIFLNEALALDITQRIITEYSGYTHFSLRNISDIFPEEQNKALLRRKKYNKSLFSANPANQT